MANQQLLDYVHGQAKEGVPLGVIARNLLDNEWTTEDVNEAFTTLGLLQQNQPTPVAEPVADTFKGEQLTMDKIIEKILQRNLIARTAHFHKIL